MHYLVFHETNRWANQKKINNKAFSRFNVSSNALTNNMNLSFPSLSTDFSKIFASSNVIV